jgi:hypothetical protein
MRSLFYSKKVQCRLSFDSGSEKVKSFRSEPIRKTPFIAPSIPLTEEELARHNRVIPPLNVSPYSQQQLENQEMIEHLRDEEDEDYEYDDLNESLLLKRVDERCNMMKQEMDEKIKVPFI